PRSIGDGLGLFLEGVLKCLPRSSATRDAWRARRRQQRISFRRHISYQAFEDPLHHPFEAGMTWTFSTCRGLTPSGALLALGGALLLLPISFGMATALRAVPIARASSLPGSMHLPLPFATFIAKSKLPVLRVYAADWARAQEQPVVQCFFQFWRYCMKP